ncbi:MAG: hypothetical protein Q9217_006925, partial [Psora testacea]
MKLKGIHHGRTFRLPFDRDCNDRSLRKVKEFVLCAKYTEAYLRAINNLVENSDRGIAAEIASQQQPIQDAPFQNNIQEGYLAIGDYLRKIFEPTCAKLLNMAEGRIPHAHKVQLHRYCRLLTETIKSIKERLPGGYLEGGASDTIRVISPWEALIACLVCKAPCTQDLTESLASDLRELKVYERVDLPEGFRLTGNAGMPRMMHLAKTQDGRLPVAGFSQDRWLDEAFYQWSKEKRLSCLSEHEIEWLKASRSGAGLYLKAIQESRPLISRNDAMLEAIRRNRGEHQYAPLWEESVALSWPTFEVCDPCFNCLGDPYGPTVEAERLKAAITFN